jgi:hypothetical protein
MRTVVGVAWRIGSRVGRSRAQPEPAAQIRPLAAGRRPLLTDRLGEQRRGGVRLDQVDGTTCGSAVLIALAAWADPAETARLDGDEAATAATGAGAGARAGVAIGFGARYDARQKEVHRQSTRFWPRALGTTPWGMVGWLRRHSPAAGPYRVRLVDDVSAADVDDALACRCWWDRWCHGTTSWASACWETVDGGCTSPRAARSARWTCGWSGSAGSRPCWGSTGCRQCCCPSSG